MHDVTIGLCAAVKRGEAKRIAVVQEMEKDIRSETTQRQFVFKFPVVSCGATYAPKRVWGFADVEEDVSEYFNVAYENLARRGTQAEHGNDARGGMRASAATLTPRGSPPTTAANRTSSKSNRKPGVRPPVRSPTW